MAERYQVAARLRQDTDDPGILRLQHGTEPADDDLVVGQVTDEGLAAYLCEAHNTYVSAFSLLVGLPHADAIPDDWRDQEREQPLSLLEVVRLICQHIPHNSVGAPAPQPFPLTHEVTCGPSDAVVVRQTDTGAPDGTVVREWVVGPAALEAAEKFGVEVRPDREMRRPE